jgi:hypothetical protein
VIQMLLFASELHFWIAMTSVSTRGSREVDGLIGEPDRSREGRPTQRWIVRTPRISMLLQQEVSNFNHTNTRDLLSASKCLLPILQGEESSPNRPRARAHTGARPPASTPCGTTGRSADMIHLHRPLRARNRGSSRCTLYVS